MVAEDRHCIGPAAERAFKTHGHRFIGRGKNDKGRIINWALELPPPYVLQRNGFSTSVYKAMEENHETITVTAFQAKDGAKHAWAAGLTRSDGKTVITLGGLPAQPYNVKPKDDRKVKP